MSGHPPTIHLPAAEKLEPGRFALTKALRAVAVIGLILSVVGFVADPRQFAFSWLFAVYYFLAIAAGAFFWVTLHHVCNAGWDVLVRRVWENMIGVFPAILVLFLPLALVPQLRDTLWTWASPALASSADLAKRSLYLNVPFFLIRAAIYFGFFLVLGGWFRANSIRQDTDGNFLRTTLIRYWSYFTMVAFALVITFLGVDWLMGLDWKWSSSLFGVYNFALSIQAGLAASIVIIALLRAAGYLKPLNAEHFHLLGKLLFGFTIFWAYIAFGQFLLIWYANIPEETIFYNDHNRHAWKYLTFVLVVGKFMFPVIYLLAQDTKRSLRALTFIAAWLLVLHGVELYWFVMPYAHLKTILPSWMDVVSWLTVGSILGTAFLCVAARHSLIPVRDPRLVESLTVTN